MVETKRRPISAMPAVSACSRDGTAARCRVRQRPPGCAIWVNEPAAARADVTGRSDDPRVDPAIGVPKSAAPGASDEEAAGGRAGRRLSAERRPAGQCRLKPRVPRGAPERMPPTQLDNYRMPTPQAHPMNDGLSLYPQAGAVSCLRSPAQIASKKAPIFL